MAVSMLAAAATQTSSLDISPRPSDSISSLSSSPRQFPSDLPHPILEEGDESDSEPVNEPVTPVSGRQSQDFHTLASHDLNADSTQDQDSLATDQSTTSFAADRARTSPSSKPPLVVDTATATPHKELKSPGSALKSPQTAIPVSDQIETTPVPFSKRTARGSASSFKRTMSNLFKRTNSSSDKAILMPPEAMGTSRTSDLALAEHAASRKTPTRRWSINKSSTTTRSSTPPSPGSPLEMAAKTRMQASTPTVPDQDAFFDKKKPRASTHFSLSRPNGKSAAARAREPIRRRASSFDHTKQELEVAGDPGEPIPIERSPWALPADTGTGVKARRMSLSLPDDFTVDVAELLSEFEYWHKFLGRHGKHLGKGATSKVTLMVRKGCPKELYAVKEFRGMSSSETKEEYEKKIKSEYTVAKSLHHPNIVETIRLCTDRGRWNHVMEYCQEGDLFGLVSKKYLTSEDREKDRICLFKQLVQGVNYLHSNGIAHRDIKLENLLVTSDSKLKITDFGVSEVFAGIHPGLREAGGQCGRGMGELRRCAPGICGSMPYISPEVLDKRGDYDPRGLDVWSSAVVMLTLIFGAPIWREAKVNGGKESANYTALVNGWAKWREEHAESGLMDFTDASYPNVPAFDHCVKPPALRRVLLRMLNPDPNERMTIAEVLNNRWVKNIECCQSESYDDPAKSIDASKKSCLMNGTKRLFIHNHLPPKEHHTHALGKSY